jgi:hypothetical protein
METVPGALLFAFFIVFVVLPICFYSIGLLAVRVGEKLQKRLTRVNFPHLRH